MVDRHRFGKTPPTDISDGSTDFFDRAASEIRSSDEVFLRPTFRVIYPGRSNTSPDPGSNAGEGP
jgi:hypothetical protein